MQKNIVKEGENVTEIKSTRMMNMFKRYAIFIVKRREKIVAFFVIVVIESEQK